MMVMTVGTDKWMLTEVMGLLFSGDLGLPLYCAVYSRREANVATYDVWSRGCGWRCSPPWRKRVNVGVCCGAVNKCVAAVMWS